MQELDPKDQQRLVELLKKSAKASGKFTDPTSIAKFHGNLRENLTHAHSCRPWVMVLAMSIYRARLCKQERRLNIMQSVPLAVKSKQVEVVESLRFAAHYGTRANPQQRATCRRQIDLHRVAPIDAQFLVWAKVINIRRDAILFGHWDWICGIIWTPPVLLIFLSAICIALSGKPSPEVKTIFTTIYLIMGCGAFSFFKAITFDAFRIGVRYFKPNGWSYTPLQRET
ncbi:hypothetical protein AAKU67_004060 [Oxalobacteraceae bacterium GrIS 2.11]